MSDPAVEPNDTELEILKRFWRDGELSAREVHERITPELDWTPSTTRTVLERMRAKRLLSRRHVHGVVVYAHLQPKVQVLGRLTIQPMRAHGRRAGTSETAGTNHPSRVLQMIVDETVQHQMVYVATVAAAATHISSFPRQRRRPGCCRILVAADTRP